MKTPSEQELEALLRQSPQPAPPGDLKDRLIRTARSAPRSPVMPPLIMAQPGWFARSRPALLPAAFSLICAVVLAVQHVQIANLKQEIQQLKTSAPADSTPTRSPQASPSSESDTTSEINRLKKLAATLTNDIAQLEQLQTENGKMRTKLSDLQNAAGQQQLDQEQMQAAMERAKKIACVNNLKQLGLAVRVWAGDNDDWSPPNILDMTNEMSTPKILFCPADTAHEVAESGFSSYNPARNLSYEYMAAGVKIADTNMNRVLFLCPIHNNVGLLDGSVQSLSPNAAATSLVRHDGVLYFEPPPRRF
jgi:hypothetical protein